MEVAALFSPFRKILFFRKDVFGILTGIAFPELLPIIS
jgi:hypothetical protein